MAKNPPNLTGKPSGFRTIKESNDSYYFELAPLNGEFEFYPPDKIKVLPNFNWPEFKREWKASVLQVLSQPFMPFSNKRKNFENDQGKYRTRTEAINDWEDYFDDSVDSLEDLLTEKCRIQVAGSILRTLKIHILNSIQSKKRNLDFQIKLLSHLMKNPSPDNAAKFVVTSLSDTFDKRIQKSVGSAQSPIKFLSESNINDPSVIQEQASRILEQQKLKKKELPHQAKLLRNHLTITEEQASEFIFNNQLSKLALSKDEIIEKTLCLFTAHWIEKTTDPESWKRTLRDAKKLSLQA